VRNVFDYSNARGFPQRWCRACAAINKARRIPGLAVKRRHRATSRGILSSPRPAENQSSFALPDEQEYRSPHG